MLRPNWWPLAQLLHCLCCFVESEVRLQRISMMILSKCGGRQLDLMWAESLTFSFASQHTSEVQSALFWQTTPFWAYRNRPAMYWQRSNVHCLVALCGSGFSEKDYNSLFGYLPGFSTTTPSRHQGFRNLWGMNEWAKEWTQWLTEELPRTSNNPMADALGSVGKTKPQYLRVTKDTKDSIKITSFYEWRDFHHCERHNIYWRLSLHQDSAQHQQNKTGLGFFR